MERPPSPSAAELAGTLRRLLGTSMGGEPRFLSGSPNPVVHAFSVLTAYALIWTVAEILALLLDTPIAPRLRSLVAWGGVYVSATALFARVITTRIFETVERDIIPYASSDYLDAVARDLASRLGPMRMVVQPILTATFATAAAAIAFSFDVDTSNLLSSPGLQIGCAILFLRFIVSSRSITAGRFYLSFTNCLQKEAGDAFYVLGAAESPLVTGLAKLSGEVLTFWAMTFLAILSAMLLALPLLGDYSYSSIEMGHLSYFLLVFIPVAGFFTLGVGSLVYLRSEDNVRASLQRFTRAQAAILQQKSNAILDPLVARIPNEADELARLTLWHDRILAGGRYGSRLGTTVSIILPFLLPAISAINYLIDWISF